MLKNRSYSLPLTLVDTKCHTVLLWKFDSCRGFFKSNWQQRPRSFPHDEMKTPTLSFVFLPSLQIQLLPVQGRQLSVWVTSVIFHSARMHLTDHIKDAFTDQADLQHVHWTIPASKLMCLVVFVCVWNKKNTCCRINWATEHVLIYLYYGIKKGNIFWISPHTLRNYIPCSFARVAWTGSQKNQKVQMN